MFNGLVDRVQGLVSMLWREVMKFGVVGAAAFVVDTGIFVWLMGGPMTGSEVKAKIVAGVVATFFSWGANRYWTFRHRRQANIARELVLFLVMNAIGLGIAAACVWVTKYMLHLTDTTSLFIAGSVVGLILGTIFRFFAYRFWVFTAELDEEPEFAHDHELLHHQEQGSAADLPAAGGRGA
ncbi:GtrA family protein [Zhihengliuella salsuginis]|uniref:GtrA/DPMS transmembrane domain-containing protein n=1 Tax=Zhihengliuella salsuginis TaxID=578222 RepID=A0ABQ3GKJ9_9MICC|nr:GtrA family protein [Zhihengliuella salsuginis]GHD09654.1 hypothetical protein GCM10008096_22530 [Zhihengliuella salsuginis]